MNTPSKFQLRKLPRSLAAALAVSAAGCTLIFGAEAAFAEDEVTVGSLDVFNAASAQVTETSVLTVNGRPATVTYTDTTTIDGQNRTLNVYAETRQNGDGSPSVNAALINFKPTDSEAVLTVQNFGSWNYSYEEMIAVPLFISGYKSEIMGLSGADKLVNVTSGNLSVKDSVFSNIANDTAGFISLSESAGTTKISNSAFIKGPITDTYTNNYINVAAVQFRGGNLIVEKSYFEGLDGAIHSGEYLKVTKTNELYVTDSVFKKNEIWLPLGGASLTYPNRVASGAAIGLVSTDHESNAVFADSEIAGTNVTVIHSYFSGNVAADGGAGIALLKSSRNVYVADSYFEKSEGNWGNDIYVEALDNTNVTLKDSEFRDFVLNSVTVVGEGDTVLNVLSQDKNTEFSGQGSDIKVSSATVNVTADAGRKVIFHDSVANRSSDLQEFNLNKAVSYTYSGYDESSGTFSTLKGSAAGGGEIRVYGLIDNFSVRAYGGTLRLLPADTEYMQDQISYQKNLAGITDDGVYNNIALRTSTLTVESETFLKTQDAEPITHEAYTVQDEAALVMLTEGVQFQNILLGTKLTLYANLMLEPAVDLTTAQADTFTVGDGNAVVTGDGKLVVAGWIVKADNTESAEVSVKLTPDGETVLQPYFGLADSGKMAYGPIYVWNVRQTEGTSEYIFYKEKPEDAVVNQQSEVLTTNEETEPAAPLPEIPHIVETPTDFNPDVYAEQVAALGTSVVQHAISNTIFGEEDAHRLEALLLDEKPERKEWWGKVIGSDLTIESKNFYDVDMYYLVAMIGHQFKPVKTSAGTFEFGAYLGAVNAREKYSVSKVQQNGAFLGGSVYWQAGGAWLGAHTNIGIMSNELTSISENRTHNPWIGVGATAGYAFPIPRYRMLVSPVVDFGYVTIRSKNYTTNLGASVKNSSLHSFEVSPGLRIDKVFDGGWKVQGEAHYVVVSKHSGKASASYADGDGVVLPRISNRSYVEYGLGIRKQDKNWGFAAKVTRSDAGHRGWAGMARVSYRF
jgi:outer membrane autotransporter protein